jgi:hypothetical protein
MESRRGHIVEPPLIEALAQSDAGAYDTTLACAEVCTPRPPDAHGVPPRRWRWTTPAIVCLVGTLLASGIAMAVERHHAPVVQAAARTQPAPRHTALPSAEPPELASELPLDTLLAAYSDPARSEEPFNDRLVRTRGTVRRVQTSPLGDVYVMIDGTRPFAAGHLECVVPVRGQRRALSLQRGDQVEVVGRVVDAGLDVVARRCKVVGVEHPDDAIPLAKR